jgi:NSS family neurotransmitter:Na+ symporter
MQQRTREHWSSYIGFIFAAAGSAIGLGTLWKFPYVTGENGGGLFVLIYILCTFFIGIPVFIAELILGRRAQRGAVGVFATLADNTSAWKGVGWLSVLSAFLIMSYYSVIGGWGLNYVLMSIMESFKGLTAKEVSNLFDMLYHSGDITLFWHLMFTAIVVVLVLPGVRQGIEYWSKFMMSGLFILLVCLFAYSITLDGFPMAVDFILSPNFDKFRPSGALEALGLSFFTLSLGQGIMLTYGSYMRKTEDIPKISFIIGIMIIVIAILASLTIFPIIFSFGFSPQEGRGLVFKTLPLLFSKLPGGLIISTTFFVLFVFAALTSAIAFVEVVAANLMDLLGWSRRKAVLVTGFTCFIFGIPSALSGTDFLFAKWPEIFGRTFFATFDDLVSIWFLPMAGLLIALYAGWFFDHKQSKEEFYAGTSFKWLYGIWLFFIRWIVPVAILAIMLQQSGIINIDKILDVK